VGTFIQDGRHTHSQLYADTFLPAEETLFDEREGGQNNAHQDELFKKMEELSYRMLPDFRKNIAFGRFPAFARLSLC